MHLSVLVVGQRVLLQSGHHQVVGYHDITRLCFNHQLQDIEQLAGIAPAEAQQCIRLLQLDVALLQDNIGMDGTVEQLQQVVFLQRLQNVKLTARQQWTYNLERRILGCSANQRDHPPFHSPQQRVLLRFREAVNLVYK